MKITCPSENSQVSSEDLALLEKHLKSLSNNLHQMDIKEIELLQQLSLNRFSHDWYGGDILKFSYNTNAYYICANGDITANLYKNSDNICLERVKDRRNKGSFFLLANYIKDDTELFKCIDNPTSLYRLEFDDRNWWELFCVRNDDVENPSYVLDADILSDALLEALNIILEISR